NALHRTEDPYYFPTIFSKFDLHLFGEGNNYKIYEKLGAHEKEFEGVRGVHFAVWAPNAKSVSVMGDFNDWQADIYQMENVNSSGTWVLFIPGVEAGAMYKYSIRSKKDDRMRIKSDPYAFYSQMRPDNASIVYEPENYKWTDTEWVNMRREWNYKNSPVSIYEVHLCSWKREHSDDFPNESGFKNYR